MGGERRLCADKRQRAQESGASGARTRAAGAATADRSPATCPLTAERRPQEVRAGTFIYTKGKEGIQKEGFGSHNGEAKLLNSAAVGRGPCCRTQENNQKSKKESSAAGTEFSCWKTQAHRTKCPIQGM